MGIQEIDGKQAGEPNGMATVCRKELLSALQAVRNGDFSVRMPGDWEGP